MIFHNELSIILSTIWYDHIPVAFVFDKIPAAFDDLDKIPVAFDLDKILASFVLDKIKCLSRSISTA